MTTANGKAATTAATLTCPECSKIFTRAAALGAHRKMTHGVAGTSKNATSKTTTGKRSTTASPRRTRATPSNGTRSVDRDALLRALFPDGIPPREELIGQLNSWLNEAERLARSR
jgi:hypothetical protein